jgi:alpha-beta hydrolase superfamily lysophospholipase
MSSSEPWPWFGTRIDNAVRVAACQGQAYHRSSEWTVSNHNRKEKRFKPMNLQSDLENEEITWPVDGIAVQATLVRPADTGRTPARRPAIAFVAGSGPTDRDWDSPIIPGSNGSGRLLAESLAGKGFVTLRYDKRASGPHAAENAALLTGKVSLQSHVDELAGAVAALASRPDVDPARIFALTSSEGALHALNYQRQATQHRFAGLVLMGVPGRSMADTMRGQVVPQIQPLPDGEEMIRQYDKAVADFIAARPIELDPSLPAGLHSLFASLGNPANQPFAREFLAVNPARLLLDVPEPVLIVIGKKDIQVNWQVDGAALETALAGRDNVTFVYPDNANHVLKHEEKPREQLTPADAAASYSAADRVLDPEALQAIQTWLAARAGGR